MIQNSLKWGAIGGLGAVVICLIIFLINPFKLTDSIGFLIYLPLLFCMVYGGITYRTMSGNKLSYGKAFLSVWVIALTGSMILNIFNSVVLFRIIYPTYQQEVQQRELDKAREKMEQKGMTDEDIEKQLGFAKKINFEILGYGMSVFYGVILSLLIAIFVKRNPDAIPTGGGTV